MSTTDPAVLQRSRALSRSQTRSRRLAASLASHAADLPFLLPVLIVIGAVIVTPTVIAIAHSFTNWNPGYASPYVGLQNYTLLLHSAQFHTILRNEAFLLIGVPFWIAIPLLLAFLLYERVRFSGLFGAIFFFPATASPALMGILFTLILGPEGPLNSFLKSLGWKSPPDWLVTANLVKPVLIAVVAWATLGTGIIIFTAGLSAIPPELFEIAEIDGATWWQRLRFVVLPALHRLIEMWTVILVITVFVALFPWIYTLTNGGPGYSSTTVDYDIYQNALTNGYFGLASAEMVYMLFLIGAVLVVVWVLFGRRRGGEDFV